LKLNLTGVLLRSTGLAYDLRKFAPYDIYSELDFSVPVGKYGDSFDRYFLRMEEMRVSLTIVATCLNLLFEGPVRVSQQKCAQPNRALMKSTMEGLIHHFKFFSEGYAVEASANYTAVESPKGELGVFLVANSSNRPYRVKIKSPSFFALQAVHSLIKNRLLADLVTLIGTCDIVFGEVDR